MAITLRSDREIEFLKKAGSVVASVLLKLQEIAAPGVTTAELDRVAMDMTKKVGGIALFKGVKSPFAKRVFPGAICASVNEQVVHGIPSRKVKLKDGDILSIDYGIKLDGYCSDAAMTLGIGEISEDRQNLIDVTKETLDVAISNSKPDVKWSKVAALMQEYVESRGFSVVTEYVGHGIGTEMWEEPRVPNFVSAELLREDIVLTEGMVLAVEPMVNMGGSGVRTQKDGWAVVTRDGMCSAHFEHTIAITADGCEVMTVI